MKRLLLATALIAAPMLAHASDAPKIDPVNLAAHIKTLSSDAFEGRGPATAGETKTVAYIVEQMLAAGLEPGGDLKDGKRAWTQDVPLGMFEIKGPISAHMMVGSSHIALNQGEQIAIRAAMTNVDKVAIQNAPIVFAGYGVKAPERNWDDFKGLDVKGKIVVVLINDPDFETGSDTKNGGDFGGKAMTYYGRWTYKFEEAARLGAAGLLIVHETAPASYGWATVKNSNTNTMFDIVRKEPTKQHPALEGWIQRDTAVELFKAAGLDFDVLKKAAQGRDFKPVELKGATFSAAYAVEPKVIVSKNVVGKLTGAKRPDETVFFTGHWDHLGVGLADARGDKIYNGAVDNATGIAAMLEMGRVFAKGPRPDRSLIFLAVTAEEKGLLGSEYYAANPLYPLAKTVGVLNTDALDPAGPAKDFTISGSAKLGLLDDLIAHGKKVNRTYTPDPATEAGYFYRSDHFPFAKRGVPAISFGSGEDLVEGGVAAGKAFADAYRINAYHQPADEWNDGWRLDGMTADISLIQGLGADLANSTRWPQWGEGSEFKATRDATKSQRK